MVSYLAVSAWSAEALLEPDLSLSCFPFPGGPVLSLAYLWAGWGEEVYWPGSLKVRQCEGLPVLSVLVAEDKSLSERSLQSALDRDKTENCCQGSKMVEVKSPCKLRILSRDRPLFSPQGQRRQS